MYVLIIFIIGLSCSNYRYTNYGHTFDFLRGNVDNVRFSSKNDANKFFSKFDTTTKIIIQSQIIKDSIFVIENENFIDSIKNNPIESEEKNSKIKISKKVKKSSELNEVYNFKKKSIVLPFQNNLSYSNDPHPALILLFCYILPPLAIYYIEGGIYSKFWVNILLLLIGLACGFFLGGAFWLVMCYPVFHALFALLFG